MPWWRFGNEDRLFIDARVAVFLFVVAGTLERDLLPTPTTAVTVESSTVPVEGIEFYSERIFFVGNLLAKVTGVAPRR